MLLCTCGVGAAVSHPSIVCSCVLVNGSIALKAYALVPLDALPPLLVARSHTLVYVGMV